MKRIVKTFEGFTADDYNSMERDYYDKMELADLGHELDEEPDPEMARAALIALVDYSRPVENVSVDGRLYGADFEEGLNKSTGDVEISWKIGTRTYETIIGVVGYFDLELGHSGRWGASVDDSEPPQPDEVSREDINIDDDSILVYDQFGNEYEFKLAELGKKFRLDLERFLLDRYDAYRETIS